MYYPAAEKKRWQQGVHGVVLTLFMQERNHQDQSQVLIVFNVHGFTIAGEARVRGLYSVGFNYAIADIT